MIDPSGSARSKIEGALLALAGQDPQARVRALVRTVEAAGPYRGDVEAAGFVVHRVLRLVPTLAVEGPVGHLLALAEQDWVRSLSLDRQVHTMRDPASEACEG
jgi:hypothetical protein